MKIAIHERQGSFSDSWIKYCKEKAIPYKIVDCYSNYIVENLQDCTALMWHYHHDNLKDSLFAKQLLFALEQTGLKVFPNFRSNWYFDDKIGQKFLLERLNAPLVPSYIFWKKETALDWAEKTSFPKVFKLRGGAGSANVQLIHDKLEAISLITKSFGKGIPQFNKEDFVRDKFKKYLNGKASIKEVAYAFKCYFISPKNERLVGRDRGYVYFQDFMADNDCDIRVIVIDKKAFAIKRKVRKNDFRASGSADILYNKDNFSLQIIEMAFKITADIKSQCCALDFILDDKNEPVLVEISYGFTTKVYEPCVGYWDDQLKFHEGKINPLDWMVESLIS